MTQTVSKDTISNWFTTKLSVMCRDNTDLSL